MSRNRFELLLRMLHFVDNKNSNGSNHLFKIQPIMTLWKQIMKYMTIHPRIYVLMNPWFPFVATLIHTICKTKAPQIRKQNI